MLINVNEFQEEAQMVHFTDKEKFRHMKEMCSIWQSWSKVNEFARGLLYQHSLTGLCLIQFFYSSHTFGAQGREQGINLVEKSPIAFFQEICFMAHLRGSRNCQYLVGYVQGCCSSLKGWWCIPPPQENLFLIPEQTKVKLYKL